MSGTVAGNGTYDATITYPTDGDNAIGASVQAGLTNAANRDSWLRDQLQFDTLISVMNEGKLNTGWSYTHGAIGLFAPNTTATQYVWIPNNLLVDGARLDTVTCFYQAEHAMAHVALPAVMPSFRVLRWNMLANLNDPIAPVALGTAATCAAANVAAYENSNRSISWTFTSTTNYDIVRDGRNYCIELTNESGANSFGGGVWLGFLLHQVIP